MLIIAVIFCQNDSVAPGQATGRCSRRSARGCARTGSTLPWALKLFSHHPVYFNSDSLYKTYKG
jgi:hypothetical protein